MATIGGQTANIASQFSADVVAYIAEKTLPLARKQLVAYQFGDPLTLPKGRGTTYTATRYIRLPLPFAPISEGVPPIGETMTIQQVSVTALQWGDKVTITDVAEMTIYHPLFTKATELVGLQVAETLERNTFQTLLSGTTYNLVNSRSARNTLVAGDVLSPYEVQRAYAALFNAGAPRFNGDEMTDTKLDADAGGAKASNNPRMMPHYTALIHPFVAADMRQNSQVVTAWSYSDINRLYNYEVGEFSGIRFCESNMVPSFTGVTAVTVATATSGGFLPATTPFFVQVTGTDLQNQFESRVYGVATVTTGAGATNSITLTTPATTGFTYNIYASLSGSVANGTMGSATNPVYVAQGTYAGQPTTGSRAGQLIGVPPGTAVTITGIAPLGASLGGALPTWGSAQGGVTAAPPAAPANGITVYPTFIIGRGAYGQVMLDDVKFTYLKEADKSDPLNQLRVIGWKCFFGTLIENQNFFMRIESVSAMVGAQQGFDNNVLQVS